MVHSDVAFALRFVHNPGFSADAEVFAETFEPFDQLLVVCEVLEVDGVEWWLEPKDEHRLFLGNNLFFSALLSKSAKQVVKAAHD